MKIEINSVAEILKKHKLEPKLLREIIDELNNLTLVSEGDDATPPAPKKQFVVLLSDATGLIRQRIDARNLVGWVLQIPEDASPFSTEDRIIKAAYEFNASKRGRLLPVKTVGEALETVTARYFKESDAWVKTKLPVAVIVTDNVLPREEFKPEQAAEPAAAPSA